VGRSRIRALSVHSHFSRPSRTRSVHLGVRRLARVPLWIAAWVVASACSRPDGDILYQPFWPADHLTDGVSGSSGLLEDAGDPTDPFRDASQGGTGGTGPGHVPMDSGTEVDAGSPSDAGTGEPGDAGDPGDAAL
jgi:hypothetical protein